MKTAIFVSAMFGTLASCSLWAQFCDDMNCSENCGQPVSLDNPGCLSNTHNRMSVKFHGGDGDIDTYSLVFSPGTDCNCQNDCADISSVMDLGKCYYLFNRAPAQSLRFQGETCSKNNCPHQSVLGNRTATPFQA